MQKTLIGGSSRSPPRDHPVHTAMDGMRLRWSSLIGTYSGSAWQDGEDPGANRLARGPQLKILHHCKRKLEELGIEINPEKDDQSSGDKTDKRLGSDGMCSVCRNDEIQVMKCVK